MLTKNLKKIAKKQNKIFIILILIFFLGLFLRIFNLTDNIIFAYDQARDAQRVYEILVNRDWKIVGPETDMPGVFNGPLLYYLLLIVYSISNFNPNVAAILFIIINLTGILLLYRISILLTKNKNVGYISAFLWATSFAQINFARFISNASPMSIATIIFFYGLVLYLFQKKEVGLIISAIGLGLSVQFNFYLIYLILAYPILYFIYQPSYKAKSIIYSFFTLLVLLSNFLISELKWQFAATKALISYFNNQNTTIDISVRIAHYLQRLTDAIYYSFFSFNYLLAFLLFIFLASLSYRLLKNKKQKIHVFLFIWLFSTLPLFSFSSGVLNGQVINSSIYAPLTIICSIAINNLLKNVRYQKIGYLLIIIFSFSNFVLLQEDHFRSIKLFAMQELLLGQEKKLIDYTYQSAKGEQFSVCAITNPLFVNTLWSYLYFYYGNNKYGYLPFWSGDRQYLNKSLIDYDTNHTSLRYLILEPRGGIPEHSFKAIIYSEDQISLIEDEQKIGQIIVQKRRLTKDRVKLKDSQQLSVDELNTVQAVIKSDPRHTCYFEY